MVEDVHRRRVRPKCLEELTQHVADFSGAIIHSCGLLSLGHFTIPTPWKGSTILEAARVAGKDPEANDFQHELGFIPSGEDLHGTYMAIDLGAMNEVLEFEPADQVVRVQAGMFAHEGVRFEGADVDIQGLADVLASENQCLPFWTKDPSIASFAASGGTEQIGTQITLDLPHPLASQCGSWRDWVIGMTLVTSDGKVVKVGSKAVKNVAGYDLQKLLVGDRGSLAIIADVTLRTYPTKALPSPSLIFGQAYRENRRGPGRWVQRVKRSDFAAAVSGAEERLFFADTASSTLWCAIESTDALPRYPGDWVIRSGCGEKNVEITDPTQIRLMKRAKEIFDPTHKLNPGEWGFM